MGLKKNVISNFILTASTILLPLITFPYITRRLSSGGLGQVFFIDSFTQYFVLLASLGIPYYGIREIAKRKHDKKMTSELVVELVVLQLTLAVLFVLIFYAFGLFIPKLAQSMSLIKIGILMIIANSFLIEWFFQGIESFSYITVRSLIIKFLSVFLILVFVNRDGDYVIYYFILATVILANASLNFIYFYRNHFTGLNFKLNIIQHLKPLLILFSINASLSIYVILDSIILGFFTDPVNVSYYNIPLKLVKIFWLVIAGIGTVFIPRIASLHLDNNKEAIIDLMSKSINIVLLLALPFCFFCLIFPSEILSIISGPKYINASSALQLLSVIPLIIGLCNIFGTQFLLPIGKEKHILHATILGLSVSLALNFILIPHLKFMGSAVAAVSAELSVCVYVYVAARKEIKIVVDYGLLFQILSSILITEICFKLLAQKYNGIPLIIMALVVYAISLLVSQLFFRNKFLSSLLNIGFLKKSL